MEAEKINQSDLIPLYIGISGHRDIREAHKPILKQLIKNVLIAKRAQCPHTPVILLTPLAEGADRLAAWAAIECSISYICPLPMPVDEYRHDFQSQESLSEFNELLEKAQDWFELPVVGGKAAHELHENKVLRDEQYYQIGFYIARHSQLLIALWDGINNIRRGGTAHIVNLKRNGLPATNPRFQQRLKNLQTGPVHHILMPRKDQPIPEDIFRETMIYPEYTEYEDERGSYVDRHFLRHLDTYNQDILELSPILNEKIPSEGIARCLHVSDSMANFFQKRRFFALRVLLILTVLAFMFFQIYAAFGHRLLLLILYPITMSIGALWFLVASKRKFEQKHEDYRALAEAFRVQYFLGMINKRANVSEYYLQKHKGELEWVIYVLRCSLFRIEPVPKGATMAEEIIHEKSVYSFVNEQWIGSQENYFRRTGQKYERLHHRHRRLANRFFLGALGSAVILFLISVTAKYLYLPAEKSYHLLQEILIVTTHSFLVISAAILGYNEKMVFSEQSKTCNLMSTLFSIARKKLARAIDTENYEEADAIIWELALESMIENADWLMLHRSRPMEIPKG